MYESKYVPWDEHADVIVWLVLIVVTTFIIHIGMEKWKESKT